MSRYRDNAARNDEVEDMATRVQIHPLEIPVIAPDRAEPRNVDALPIPVLSIPVDAADRVLAAINDSRYLWRSPEGIATDTGLPTLIVKEILDLRTDRLIKSMTVDAQGRAVYTTPEHYRANAGILRRALSALSDQVR
jgi:hypothetical protein